MYQYPEVPDSTTELTELLGGKSHCIGGYIATSSPYTRGCPNLNSVRFGTNAVLFVTAPRRPFSVRQALTQLKGAAVISSIDRPLLPSSMSQVASHVIDTPCFSRGQFSAVRSRLVKYRTIRPCQHLLAEPGTNVVRYRSYLMHPQCRRGLA